MCISPLRVSSQHSTWSCLRTSPHNLSLNTAYTHCMWTQVCEPLLRWKLPFCMISVMNLLILPCASLWFLTLNPPVRGGFLLCGKFSFRTPSQGRVPVFQIFYLPFCLYLLSYLIPRRLLCLSGCLGSSVLQKMFWELFSMLTDLLIIHPKQCEKLRWQRIGHKGEPVSLTNKSKGHLLAKDSRHQKGKPISLE